jgi:DNA invertase Pin-like site-specific DNA recombinase
MAVFGYARVSTRDQNLDLQNAALLSAGAEKVVTEVASGKSMDRPQLQQLLVRLEPGDVLLIWKLDRLGRSLSGVLATLEALAARGVAYRSLSEPMIDSTKDDHLSRALVGVLAVFAQLERDIIRERVREGVAIAKAQGKMQGRGRPKALGALDERALLAAAAAGERTVSDLCRRFRISRTTYYRLAGAHEGREESLQGPGGLQCHGT